MKKYNLRFIGSNIEKYCIDYLKNIGYEIITQNYRSKVGEIDIIAKDKDQYVFIEVKYIADNKYYNIRKKISNNKIYRIYKTALVFLKEHKIDIDKVKLRIDAIFVDKNFNINYIKNIFQESN